MRGWQLIEIGVLLAASALWLAKQYLKSDVPQPRPGLSLRDEGRLEAPPESHERLVALCYRSTAGVGAILIVVGAIQLATAPPPPPPPPPPPIEIPIRLGPIVEEATPWVDETVSPRREEPDGQTKTPPQ